MYRVPDNLRLSYMMTFQNLVTLKEVTDETYTYLITLVTGS